MALCSPFLPPCATHVGNARAPVSGSRTLGGHALSTQSCGHTGNATPSNDRLPTRLSDLLWRAPCAAFGAVGNGDDKLPSSRRSCDRSVLPAFEGKPNNSQTSPSSSFHFTYSEDPLVMACTTCSPNPSCGVGARCARCWPEKLRSTRVVFLRGRAMAVLHLRRSKACPSPAWSATTSASTQVDIAKTRRACFHRPIRSVCCARRTPVTAATATAAHDIPANIAIASVGQRHERGRLHRA
mmetsp:Transcript_6754/g.16777  ORF Transcript_6754/g.16777 Transcript_6754/m.16777 type:complete len:240 (+) Transcript_6754:2965-3684(+)